MKVAEQVEYVFGVAPTPTIPIAKSTLLYAVKRIFCVGRNYADHAAEMGVEVDREAPFYFLKPASALTESGMTIPYPPGTSNYHYEMELVVALGAPAFKVTPKDAQTKIFGYACGLDMTRRDLQLAARAKGRPWDLGKAFEQSAIVGKITPTSEVKFIGPQCIELRVNGVVRQKALLEELLWSVPEIISHLSGYYHLGPGDLIFTGTPAGVGPVRAGDWMEGTIDGLDAVSLAIGDEE